MNDAMIVAEDVTVRFKPYIDRKPTLRKAIANRRTKVDESVTALDSVSFSVEAGEAFGIIGSNGAGKSTLLRVLAGTLKPDYGTIEVAGRTSSLLQLGVGFNMELSGRRNIYLGALAAGLTTSQIEPMVDDIIDYAELRPAIDRPVKGYSSGMFSRLGFAVAMHLDPDILLLDEVLSVGDESFRQRSMSAMDDMLERSGTIVFVSHALTKVQEFCDRVLWMDQGRVRMLGPADEVVSTYLMEASESASYTKPILYKGIAEAQTPSGPPPTFPYHEDFAQLAPGWHTMGAESSLSLDGGMVWSINGRSDAGTFSLFRRLDLEAVHPVQVSCELHFEDWEEITYVAVGWHDGRQFWHDRIDAPAIGAPVLVDAIEGSPSFSLTNGFSDASKSPWQSIRITVKGRPTPSARVRVQAIDVREAPSPIKGLRLGEAAARPPAEAAISAWESWDPLDPRGAAADVVEWLTSGLYLIRPRHSHVEQIDLDSVIVDQSERMRSNWHALEPLAAIMVSFPTDPNQRELLAALGILQGWLAREMTTDPSDPRYVWHPRTVAVRGATLARAYQWVVSAGAAAPLQDQLLKAIIFHGELLNAPTFVSRAFPSEFHVFSATQAMALLLMGHLVPGLGESSTWVEHGEFRLSEHLDQYAAKSEADFREDLALHDFLEATLRALSLLGGGERYPAYQRLVEALAQVVDGRRATSVSD